MIWGEPEKGCNRNSLDDNYSRSETCSTRATRAHTEREQQLWQQRDYPQFTHSICRRNTFFCNNDDAHERERESTLRLNVIWIRSQDLGGNSLDVLRRPAGTQVTWAWARYMLTLQLKAAAIHILYDNNVPEVVVLLSPQLHFTPAPPLRQKHL